MTAARRQQRPRDPGRTDKERVMARTAVLGLPRMGPNRELKHALESYWAGSTGEAELRETAWGLRAASWGRTRAAGVDVVPCGDVSLYDHVLDAAWAIGAIPDPTSPAPGARRARGRSR
jgi:5-methyltetrahydropteroyltriglutamate--homocysteine methyltransferase